MNRFDWQGKKETSRGRCALTLLVLCTALLSFGGLASQGATYNVPGDYSTIQAAIDVAVGGDTVVVADGTYKGAGNKNVSIDGNITLRSASGDPSLCIIDCQGGGFAIDASYGATIVGFTIMNGSASGVLVNRATVMNCSFSGNVGGGVCGGYCSVMNCSFSGNSAGAGGGASLYRGSFMNCSFSGNSAMHGGGVYASQSDVVHCSFSDNSASYGSGLYSIDCMVMNCILWGNSPVASTIVVEGDTTVTYTDVQGGWEGAGNMNADPLFVDAANGDLHLQPCSPCIDAGQYLPWVPTDLEGTVRPQGDGVDMGAYEVVPSPVEELIGDLAGDVEALVDAGVLKPNQANGLLKPLDNALRSWEKGNTEDACNQLADFIAKTWEKVEDGVLSEEQGQALIDQALALLERMGSDGG